MSLQDGLLCDANGERADDGLEFHLPEIPDEDEEEAGEDPAAFGPTCLHSRYGGASTWDERELVELLGPDENGGLVWTAKIVPRDAAIKPRRGMPFPVPMEDFLGSVRRVGSPAWEAEADTGYDELWDRDGRHASATEEEHSKARWVFRGVMNGWPGLTLLEARKVRIREPESFVANVIHKYYGGSTGAKKVWDVNTDGQAGVELADAIRKHAAKGGKDTEILVELRAPSWTSQGWSARSPGFVFMVEGATVDNPTGDPTVT